MNTKNPLISVLMNCYNGEKYIRDFVEVKKVAFTFLQDLNFNNDGNFSPRVKNIFSGKGVSILEFSNYWLNHWNAKGSLLTGNLQDRENELIQFVGKL